LITIIAVFALIELTVSATVENTVGTAVIDNVVTIIAAFKLSDNGVAAAIAVGSAAIADFIVAIIARFVTVIAGL
jgi:hypothetical protein